MSTSAIPNDAPGAGLKARLLGRARRTLVHILHPVFLQHQQVQADLSHRLMHAERDRADLAEALRVAHAKGDALNAKLDALNAKLEGLLANFGALSERQDGLKDDIAAVVALNWDHVAVVRRLGQIEDRLARVPDEAEGDACEPFPDSLRFPAFERFPSAEPDAGPGQEPCPVKVG